MEKKGERKNQVGLNKEIELFIVEKDFNKASFTKADIEFIQQYEGSGGQASKGARGEGILHEFYTPHFIVELMWEIALNYGYKDGPVLEPSIGTGRMILPSKDYSKCVGFEINPVSARIAEVSCPGATIHRGYFETAFLKPERFTTRLKEDVTWLKEYPFSLIIGNPPYGVYKNRYSSFFPSPSIKQIEIFFMYYGLKLLKKDGLLVFLTASGFLRSGNAYERSKHELEKLCDIVDAYRLPPVFKASKVPVDILVFRRK
jgi:type I restriction-modification system DNA methylase subunit